jgi:hypothetical protein
MLALHSSTYNHRDSVSHWQPLPRPTPQGLIPVSPPQDDPSQSTPAACTAARTSPPPHTCSGAGNTDTVNCLNIVNTVSAVNFLNSMPSFPLPPALFLTPSVPLPQRPLFYPPAGYNSNITIEPVWLLDRKSKITIRQSHQHCSWQVDREQRRAGKDLLTFLSG